MTRDNTPNFGRILPIRCSTSREKHFQIEQLEPRVVRIARRITILEKALSGSRFDISGKRKIKTSPAFQTLFLTTSHQHHLQDNLLQEKDKTKVLIILKTLICSLLCRERSQGSKGTERQDKKVINDNDWSTLCIADIFHIFDSRLG